MLAFFSQCQQRCMEKLLALRAQGVTLVCVSHNLPAVEALCDRSLLLCAGQAVFLGDPKAVTARYLSPSGDQPNASLIESA